MRENAADPMHHMLTPPPCSHIRYKSFLAPFLPVHIAVVAISLFTELAMIIAKPFAGNNFFAYFDLFGTIFASTRTSGLTAGRTVLFTGPKRRRPQRRNRLPKERAGIVEWNPMKPYRYI
jgi:hypothetical protein